MSTTEAISTTPSGRLLHGIMASIAQFDSQNLATEVVKGMRQKAIQGGTPGRAPLGYLNERRLDDGREVRARTRPSCSRPTTPTPSTARYSAPTSDASTPNRRTWPERAKLESENTEILERVRALDLLQDVHATYVNAPVTVQKQLNQAIFAGIFLGPEPSQIRSELNEPFATITQPG